MSYVTDIIEEDGARELDGGEVDGADLGGEDSLPHRHRLLAVDRLAELDQLIATYDEELYRPPAGSNIRSFLVDCLAGPLVGSDPRHVHSLCDMLDHARHSYRPFGQLELNNFLNLLAELKTVVSRNIQNRPQTRKKSSTPVQNKLVNRPRKRVSPSPAVRYLIMELDRQ